MNYNDYVDNIVYNENRLFYHVYLYCDFTKNVYKPFIVHDWGYHINNKTHKIIDNTKLEVNWGNHIPIIKDDKLETPDLLVDKLLTKEYLTLDCNYTFNIYNHNDKFRIRCYQTYNKQILIWVKKQVKKYTLIDWDNSFFENFINTNKRFMNINDFIDAFSNLPMYKSDDINLDYLKDSYNKCIIRINSSILYLSTYVGNLTLLKELKNACHKYSIQLKDYINNHNLINPIEFETIEQAKEFIHKFQLKMLDARKSIYELELNKTDLIQQLKIDEKKKLILDKLNEVNNELNKISV